MDFISILIPVAFLVGGVGLGMMVSTLEPVRVFLERLAHALRNLFINTFAKPAFQTSEICEISEV